MSERTLLSKDLLQVLDEEFGSSPHFLERRFPHVLQRIVGLWGKPEIDAYLYGLLGPLRSGASGFPKEALAEIVMIKAYCRTHGFAGTGVPPGSPGVREAFLSWLNYDQHAYPYTVEAEFPELLEEMLPLLGTPALSEHIDGLMRPDKQLHHCFSEVALMELMMLKAVQHAKLAADKPKEALIGDEHYAGDEHHAALILDRHHRR